MELTPTTRYSPWSLIPDIKQQRISPNALEFFLDAIQKNMINKVESLNNENTYSEKVALF